MHAFDWLNTLADWMLSLIPRVCHIKSTQAGVRFTCGKAYSLRSGLHVYWPVWSEIQVTCVVRSTIDLRYQALIAKDGTGVVVTVTVVYEIIDALKALTLTDNIVSTIADLAQKSVKLVISSCTTEELKTGRRPNRKSVDRVLTTHVASCLREYGVKVNEVFLADVTLPRIVHVLSNTGHVF